MTTFKINNCNSGSTGGWPDCYKLWPYDYQFTQLITQGYPWICPLCGCGVAPWIERCPCNQTSLTITAGGSCSGSCTCEDENETEK